MSSKQQQPKVACGTQDNLEAIDGDREVGLRWKVGAMLPGRFAVCRLDAPPVISKLILSNMNVKADLSIAVVGQDRLRTNGSRGADSNLGFATTHHMREVTQVYRFAHRIEQRLTWRGRLSLGGLEKRASSSGKRMA